MIYSKIFEIYPPCLGDYIIVCDNAYDEEDFLLMEARILEVLDFDLNTSYSYDMMTLIFKEMEVSQE